MLIQKPSYLMLCALGILGITIQSASAFHFNPVLGIHHAVLAVLKNEPQLQAIVKLDSKFSNLDYGNCTGTFISDQLVITAAHCLTRDEGDTSCFDRGGCSPTAQRTTAYMQRPEGGFYMIGDSTEFVISDAKMDLAILRFPKGTFKGTPMAYRIFSEELKEELEKSTIPLVTYGYGLTESGRGDDALRSSPLPVLKINEEFFTSSDRLRVDHGDSGGPVLALSPQGRLEIVAVNHAYFAHSPETQLFKPLNPVFMEQAAAKGLAPAAIECLCQEQLTFQQYVRNEGEETCDFSDANLTKLQLLTQWTDNRDTPFTILKGSDTCVSHTRPASIDWYRGERLENGEQSMIRKASDGRACKALP